MSNSPMQRILFVGLGSLGSQIFDLLVRVSGHHSFLVGGKNLEYLRQRTNLAVFAAAQLGSHSDVAYTHMDLQNVERTAETIARFQPHIIVCAATLQRLEATHTLPKPIAEQLSKAQLGPRLPLHLALIFKLMQAIQLTGLTITVINAIYPDVVGPVLRTVGLAPTTGIGDLANNIPALRQSVSVHEGVDREQVDVRLVMARYVSYWMSRRSILDTPFHFSAFLNGEERTHLLNIEEIFRQLPTTLKRLGGQTGLLMTAASAACLFEAIVNDAGKITHAPAPQGLPGGYPVKADREGVEVVLPAHLSLDAAIQINEAGLLLDGIEKIDHDGTVYFAEQNMTIMKQVLGYECRRMPLSEVDARANELQARYKVLERKYQ